VEENRGQRVISNRQKWYRYLKTVKKKAACPLEGKAQQGSAWAGDSESAAKEGSSQREVRRTFKMLKEVWLNIGVQKIDIHKGVTVKVLLDSGATGVFMDKRLAAKQGFKLKKLERPLVVKNIDGTYNSRGATTYQVEVNVYYRKHMERGVLVFHVMLSVR